MISDVLPIKKIVLNLISYLFFLKPQRVLIFLKSAKKNKEYIKNLKPDEQTCSRKWGSGKCYDSKHLSQIQKNN